MIEVSHLTKSFGSFVAVDDVSFRVERGECVGFLGPNGAGKTTTMRVLAGIFPPTSGSVRVAGHDVRTRPEQARARLGYFPEHAPYYPDASVEGYLRFVARAKRIPSTRRLAAVEAALDACSLGEVRRRLVGQLSKGFRQRVGLAQALLGDPEVLILDEPTSGLDPAQVAEIRAVVRGLRGSRTVLFSSHVLSEVSQVAQRVVIVNRGRLVAEDSTERLTLRLEGAVTLRLRLDVAPQVAAPELRGVPGIRTVDVTEDASALRVLAADEAAVARLSPLVVARGWAILELARDKLTLEDVFLRVVAAEPPVFRDPASSAAAGFAEGTAEGAER